MWINPDGIVPAQASRALGRSTRRGWQGDLDPQPPREPIATRRGAAGHLGAGRAQKAEPRPQRRGGGRAAGKVYAKRHTPVPRVHAASQRGRAGRLDEIPQRVAEQQGRGIGGRPRVRMATKLTLEPRQLAGGGDQPRPRGLDLPSPDLMQRDIDGQRRRGGGLGHLMQHGPHPIAPGHTPPSVADTVGKPTKT